MAMSATAQERAKILNEQNLTVKQLLDVSNDLATEQFNDNLTKLLETASILYALRHRNKSEKSRNICTKWAEFENSPKL